MVRPYLDDMNTPDLWGILEATRSHAKAELGTPEDFQPFSDEEKRRIKLSINDFCLSVQEKFDPTQEKLNVIDARLKYLSDALDKHNKFDWNGIAINTVMAISIALLLDTHHREQLIQLFKQAFSNALYLP